jgi:hypothetical protein
MATTRYTTVTIMHDETSQFEGEQREAAEASALRYLRQLPGQKAVIRIEDVDAETGRRKLIDFWTVKAPAADGDLR